MHEETKKPNKLVNILKVFVLPKEMVKITKINSLLYFVLIILSALLSVFSSRLSSTKEAKALLDLPSVMEELPDDFTVKNSDGEEFPVLSINYSTTSSTDNGLYTGSFVKDETTTYVTVLVDTSIENFTTLEDYSGFDFEGYFHQELPDGVVDILYIITSENTYYSYNLAFYDTLNSYVNDGTSKKMYLPTSMDELKINEYGNLDINLWTKEVTESSATIDFDITDVAFKDYAGKITPATKLSGEFSSMFYGQSFPNSILLNYGLTIDEENYSFKSYHESMVNAAVSAYKARYDVLGTLMALAIALIFPPILSLIVWIISRQFVLKRYKEYYGICSVCFFDISLIALIVGYFIQYSSFAFVYLALESIMFVIMVIAINNEKIKEERENKRPKEATPSEKVQSEYTEIG